MADIAVKLFMGADILERRFVSDSILLYDNYSICGNDIGNYVLTDY